MRQLNLPEIRRKKSSHLTIIGKFIIHALTGTTIFLVILLIAFGLNWLVHLIGSNGTDKIIIDLLTFTEYATIVIDIFVYLWFLFVSAIKFLKEIR